MYCGRQKPTSLQEYISNFISEIKTVASNGLNIDSFYVKLKLKAIVCFFNCIKGYSAYSSCEGCVEEGKWIEGRIVFSDSVAAPRTDASD